MLGYLTTSFREHPRLRAKSNRILTTGMAKRLQALGIPTAQDQLSRTRTSTASLFAVYMKAGGETRSSGALERQAERTLAALRERGYDLGYGHAQGFAAPAEVRVRMDAIYAHARSALYASLDQARLSRLSEKCIRVATTSASREEYLYHPTTGETISDEDCLRLMRLYRGRAPRIQIVISDGLNANAVNDNLGRILPPLKRLLIAGRFSPGSTEVVVTNGRVRAGYHVGRLVGADAVIHFIGERPGTGLNTLSAYLTYGLDGEGNRRWDGIGHSDTTAICGINSKAKSPRAAVEEIRTCVARMFKHRRSGVSLGSITE
jgi:ethanolamine ammonia-lyase large subunit